MDHPSNGVSILGCLRPAFADEEFYVRRLFHYEDSDGYNSDWKGILCSILGCLTNWDWKIGSCWQATWLVVILPPFFNRASLYVPFDFWHILGMHAH